MILLTYDFQNGVMTINGIEFLGTKDDYNNALANYNKFNNHVLSEIYNKPESTRIALSMDDLKKTKDEFAKALKKSFNEEQERLKELEEEIKKKQ